MSSSTVVLNNLFATQSFQHIFPPGKIAKSGSDLLTFICIYRI
jgi:hypothetical protein